ncbi:MAG: hypothetical protein JSS82_02990 [Bacteroidetes bacterium]|nr:hypothetical protein [Bacteroidota bacterium]
MKKLLLSICMCALVIGGTSCKKSWTCVCTKSYDNNGVIETETESTPMTGYKKSMVQETCDAMERTYSSPIVATCDIK